MLGGRYKVLGVMGRGSNGVTYKVQLACLTLCLYVHQVSAGLQNCFSHCDQVKGCWKVRASTMVIIFSCKHGWITWGICLLTSEHP